MTDHTPFFSIVTPIYNCEKYIAETILSVLHQTFSSWEMVIVDDGSSDSSVSIIEEFAKKDNRIRLICLDKNSGSCYFPRKTAILESKGKYIVELDADDLFSKDYLDVMKEVIDKTNADLVYADMFLFYNEKNTKQYFENGDLSLEKVYSGTDIFKYSLEDWSLSGVGATRKSIYLESLEYCDNYMLNPPGMNSFDNENVSRLNLYFSKKVILSKAVYFYRQIPSSVTHKILAKNFGLLLSDIKLVELTANKFGEESEEYVVAQRQMFHHVIEFIRILNKNKDLASNPRLLEIVSEAWNKIELKKLKGRVSWKFYGLASFGLLFTKAFIRFYER